MKPTFVFIMKSYVISTNLLGQTLG